MQSDSSRDQEAELVTRELPVTGIDCRPAKTTGRLLSRCSMERVGAIALSSLAPDSTSAFVQVLGLEACSGVV